MFDYLSVRGKNTRSNRVVEKSLEPRPRRDGRLIGAATGISSRKLERYRHSGLDRERINEPEAFSRLRARGEDRSAYISGESACETQIKPSLLRSNSALAIGHARITLSRLAVSSEVP